MGLIAALGGRQSYVDANVVIFTLQGDGEFVRFMTDRRLRGAPGIEALLLSEVAGA